MDKKQTDKKISRSQFFLKTGMAATSITLVGGSIFALDFLSPNVLLEPSPIFKAGLLEDFSPGSVTFDAKDRVYIIREKAGYLYALSAVCTHLGCLTRWKEEEGIISCPCHGSKFTKTGEVIQGPAPKPLPRFLITMDNKNEIVVDKSTIVDENQILKV